MKLWRILVAGLVGCGLTILCALILLHSNTGQSWVFSTVSRAAKERACLSLHASEFSFRLWPARLTAEGLRIEGDDGGAATVERLSAEWHWAGILATPPRFEKLRLEGLVVDAGALPKICASETAGEPIKPLRAVEVEDFSLEGIDAAGGVGPVSLRASGLRLNSALEDGRLRLAAEELHLRVMIEDRPLDLGATSLTLEGSAEEMALDDLRIVDGSLSLAAGGSLGLEPTVRASADFSVELEAAEILAWFDPDLAEDYPVEGRLRLSGSMSWNPATGIAFEARHIGPPVRAAGYDIGDLSLEADSSIYSVRAADPSWGEATFTTTSNGARVNLELYNADPAPALLLAPVDFPFDPPPDVRLTGKATTNFALPLDLTTLDFAAEIEGHWSDGVLHVTAAGTNGGFTVNRFEGQALGLTFAGHGVVKPVGNVEGEITFSVSDPASTAAEISLTPDLPALGGGRVEGRVHFAGPIEDPTLTGDLRWERPEVGDFRLLEMRTGFSGNRHLLSWTLTAAAEGDTTFAAGGTASVDDRRIEGRFEAAAADLERAGNIWPTRPAASLKGAFEATGEFFAQDDAWAFTLSAGGKDLEVGGTLIPRLALEAEGDPSGIALTSLESDFLAGNIAGNGFLTIQGSAPTIDLNLEWMDLNPAVALGDVPLLGGTTLSGSLEVTGPLASPAARAVVSWTAGDPRAFLGRSQALLHFEDGVLSLTTIEIPTVAGPLTLNASFPLGDLDRPSWLWPEAPGGAWNCSVVGQRLNLGPLLEIMDSFDGIALDAVTDLEADIQWHPSRGGLPQAQISLFNLSGRAAGEPFSAAEPIRLAFDGEEIVLGETPIHSEGAGFTIGGRFDLTESTIDISLEGLLNPDLGRLIPLDQRIEGPVRVSAHVHGPLNSLGGRIRIRHENGTIRFRDPPVQLDNLDIEADLKAGVVDVRSGSARLNRGRVYFGGGWNPKVGQGLVAEFEDVTALLPGGILSRWSGVVAVEPSPDRLALVVGDLTLQKGVWDQAFDLAGAILGATEVSPEAEDPTQDIDVSLEVRDRSGIHIDNNLGRFDIRWNVLEIGGNVASPTIRGDIKILPGGIIKVAGKTIPIRRGLIQFTGDPQVDPVLEIIPARETTTILGSSGSDTTQPENGAAAIGVSGLSAGLGTMLGLENTSIRPEEIAIETETDTSTEFSIGQQFGQSTALFLTTDLRDSQKRVTLLQFWRLPTFPGLTVQAMTRTDTEEADLKLLQRFSWGGPEASEDQPRLGKVKLSGDWPISKRRLRKASGLIRDQYWDPFLLFFGELRLERELAMHGYPEARVSSEVRGNESSPVAVFSCDLKRRMTLRIEGTNLPKAVERRVKSLYRFPPLEEATLKAMRTVILRHLWSEGFSTVEAEIRSGGSGDVVVEVRAGPRKGMVGPIFEGLPVETRTTARNLLSSQPELAELARDPERAGRILRRLLASSGFRDVEGVTSWTEETTDGETAVHIRTVPGPRSIIGELTRLGEDPLGVISGEAFGLREGMPLDRNLIDREVSRVRGAYRRAGYTDVVVKTRIERLDAGRWRLVFELDSGSTFVVDRVEITGRRHTSDRTIRRGVSVKPGKVFRLDDLDDTVARLATFEPLERVDATTRQEGSNLVVALDVTEKPRWTAEIGGGWNSDRGATARLGLYDSNLFGRGVRAALRGRLEQNFKQGRFILALPPLPGGRFSAGINASFTEDVLEPANEFDLLIHEHTYEATLEGNYLLSAGLWVRSYYRVSRTRTFEPEPFDPFFAVDVTTDLATLGGQILYDRLDNPFDPRSGAYLGLDLSWSGEQIGSDTGNVRGLFSASLAHEPRPNWTWFQSLRLGAARPLNDVLDRKSRFFAGGPSSIRGFRSDSVGPVENLGGTAIFAGGEALFVINEELRVPVWQALRGAVFVDAGRVWETWSDADAQLAVGAGLGLRWGTPIGPLWVDAAWPIANRGTNSGVRFSFGIGRTF